MKFVLLIYLRLSFQNCQTFLFTHILLHGFLAAMENPVPDSTKDGPTMGLRCRWCSFPFLCFCGCRNKLNARGIRCLHPKAQVDVVYTSESASSGCLLSSLLGAAFPSVGHVQDSHLVHEFLDVCRATLLYQFILAARVVGIQYHARIATLSHHSHCCFPLAVALLLLKNFFKLMMRSNWSLNFTMWIVRPLYLYKVRDQNHK